MNVVVGVDGSDESMRALQFAAGEARLRGARLRVVHAFRIPTPEWMMAGAAVDPTPFEARARRLVEDALTAVGRDLLDVDVEPVVEIGGPALILLGHATAEDVLVVGSRGRGGFKGLLLGSVSQQVVSHASCPVVVVHGVSD